MTNLSDNDIRQAFEATAPPMPPFEAARRRRWLVAEVSRATGATRGLAAGSAPPRAARLPRRSPALRLTASLVAGALVLGVGVVGLWSGRDRLGDGLRLAMGGDGAPMALPIGSPWEDVPERAGIPGRTFYMGWEDALTCRRLTGFSREATDQEITEAGIAYLLADTGAATDYEVTARANELPSNSACARGEYATVASSFLGIEDDGALTSALTVWGPDAAAPYTPLPWGEQWESEEVERRMTPEVGQTDLSGGSVTTVVWDLSNKLSLGWASGQARWVITASGVDLETALAVAARVNADQGVERIAELLPGMTSVPVGPKPAASPAQFGWGVEYSTPEDATVPGDGSGLVATGYEWYLGVNLDYPAWPADVSTQELAPEPRDDEENSPISRRIVSFGGQQAMLVWVDNAPSPEVQGVLYWTPSPGVQAHVVRTGRVGTFTQADVISVASSTFAVAVDDPRLSGHFLKL